MTPHQHRIKIKIMNVIINRAEYDDGWKERVEENLAMGHDVELQNFVYPDDMEACHLLANKHAKVCLNPEQTTCYFKRSKM
jgi:hypothetical protein